MLCSVFILVTECEISLLLRFLLDNGAFPATMNNEGQTPKDLVEDCEDEQDNYQEIMDMIQAEIDRLGWLCLHAYIHWSCPLLV